MQPEIYRKVKDYPLYEVSNYGNVRSWKNNRWGKREHPKPLRAGLTCGRLSVSLQGREKRSRLVHRLVAAAFLGDQPEGMQCCHNDGNPLNNHLDNLRWDTPSNNNNADKKKHGTLKYGEKCYQSKLKLLEVVEIKRLFSLGVKQVMLAKMFKTNPTNVYKIIKGIRWSYALSKIEA